MTRHWYKIPIEDQIKVSLKVDNFSKVNEDLIKETLFNKPDSHWLYLYPSNTNPKDFQDFHNYYLKKYFVRYGLCTNCKVDNLNLADGCKSDLLNVQHHNSLSNPNDLKILMDIYDNCVRKNWSSTLSTEILMWSRNQFIQHALNFETHNIYSNGEHISTICLMKSADTEEEFYTITWIWIKKDISKTLRSEVHSTLKWLILLKKKITLYAIIANYNAPSLNFFLKLGFEVKWAAMLLK